MLTRELKRIRLYLVLFIIIASLMVVVLTVQTTKDARVYFFNVGQGDASMIMLPYDVQIVIDGGPDDSVVHALGAYLPFYDRTIEYMILSHPHSDHINGLIAIAKRYHVTTFIYNNIRRDLEALNTLFEALDAQGTTIIGIDAPRTINFSAKSRLEIIFPDHKLSASEYEDFNDSSIIARFIYGDVAFLFTGDAPKEIEQYLLDNGVVLRASVLKVGHQGSKTSSDPDFIKAVAPLYGVIMVGKNNYGHPHYRTLKTLRDLGVVVLRTDREGDILFSTDGTVITKE